MMRLDGKRVLLVCPSFFGYDRDIAEELERRGAHVDRLQDRPFDTPVLKALTRLHPHLVMPSADGLYTRLLEEFAASRYDIVLVINGQTLSRHMLQTLRNNYPRALFILYLWDALANRAHVKNNLDLYDRRFTFDPNDAMQYGLQLRPLFFSRGFESSRLASTDCYDISFIGTVHSDRFAVIDKLRRDLPSGVAFYHYLYIQARWVFEIYRFSQPNMRNAKVDDFKFVPLSKSAVQDVFCKSRSILDIEHSHQSGLTIRTFESLGAGKKLITTNSSIKDYDFYEKENICVLERSSPRVSKDFFYSPFQPLSASTRRRYSIEGWLDEVLGSRA